MSLDVEDEKFDEALQKANKLGADADAITTGAAELQQKKAEYEQAWVAIQVKLNAVPRPSPFLKLAPQREALVEGQGQVGFAVEDEKFEQALQIANDLATKADAYSERLVQIQRAKDEYEQLLTPLQVKLNAALQLSPPSATAKEPGEKSLLHRDDDKTDFGEDLAKRQKDLASFRTQMETVAQAEDFEGALQQAQALDAKTDAYNAAVESQSKATKPEGGAGDRKLDTLDRNGGSQPASPGPADAGLIGFPGAKLEGEIPQAEFEQEAWGGRIKVVYKLKAIVSAKVGSPSSVKLVLDEKGLTAKIAATVWESHGKVSLAGVDVFKEPKFEIKGKLNLGGAEVKASYSVETPIGKAAVTLSLAEIKVKEKIKIGKLGGTLEGKPIKCGELTIDGFEIKDIEVAFTGEIEIGPDWINIVAKKLAEEVIERGASEVGMQLAVEGRLGYGRGGNCGGNCERVVKGFRRARLDR